MLNSQIRVEAKENFKVTNFVPNILIKLASMWLSIKQKRVISLKLLYNSLKVCHRLKGLKEKIERNIDGHSNNALLISRSTNINSIR